jgi:hypothetical protein
MVNSERRTRQNAGVAGEEYRIPESVYRIEVRPLAEYWH